MITFRASLAPYLPFMTLVCLSLGIATPRDLLAAREPAAPGKVENFQLIDHTGVSRELYRQKLARVVVIFVAGNGCPIVRQSVGTLNELEKEFSSQGVEFWMLNANPQDDRASVQKEANEFNIDFPILLDRGQWVAKSLNISRTAEAIAISTKDWKIVYRGAVDDRLGYGTQKPKAEKTPLADALREFLAEKPVSLAKAEVRGCAITYPATPDDKAAITYTQHAAPILQKNCVGCHSPGHIGPFSMSNYEKVKGWSAMIREVLLEQRMPPWPADPQVGHFANSRFLSIEETQTLLNWIAQGSPRGEGQDPLATLTPSAPAEWPLGKPDVVVSMPNEFVVPATGVVPYQYFVVESPLPEDSWVRATTIRAGNPKVLHHALIFVKYPEALKSIEPRQNAGTAGYFAGFVPGAEPVPFPEGTAKFLPKGTKFVFQMHYAATGKEERDRTELGLYLSKEKPKYELRTRAVTQQDLGIPPGSREYPAKASYKFRKPAVLHNLSPHMHVRGSSFKYELIYPDGKSETLLSVPRWDFAWQTLYQLKQPIEVPAGAQLVCSGTFDNSAANPSNPDPKQWVVFGEQTTDEMFIGYYDIAVTPLDPVTQPKQPKEKPKSAAAPAPGASVPEDK
mgnify:CR=1 FL=1